MSSESIRMDMNMCPNKLLTMLGYSHSVKTMTSVFFPPSATKSSKLSSLSSMPPNSSLSVKPSASASEPTS